MSKFTPVWKTPLATQLQDWQNAEGATVTVQEWPAMAYFIVRGREVGAGLSAALGVSQWPESPLSSVAENGVRILWLSPDEWAVIADFAEHEALAEKLQQGLGAQSGQVVDNCGGYTGLRVSGENALMVLRHLTPYAVEQLALGRVVGTVMSQAHVILSRPEASCYEIIIRRSFADYVWKLLCKAARPYGLAVV